MACLVAQENPIRIGKVEPLPRDSDSMQDLPGDSSVEKFDYETEESARDVVETNLRTCITYSPGQLMKNSDLISTT